MVIFIYIEMRFYHCIMYPCTNVEDVGPALYKCYTNGLCLLAYQMAAQYIRTDYDILFVISFDFTIKLALTTLKSSHTHHREQRVCAI